MIRNYFRTAVRSMRRQAGTTFINVFGLAVGMGTCLLILSFIRYETGFDEFHPEADRLFRITSVETYKGVSAAEAQAPQRLVPDLTTRIPGIELATRVNAYGDRVVSRGEDRFIESSGAFADEYFLDVMGLGLRIGDTRTALQDPWSVVISESFADKYFGDGNPFGRELIIDQDPYVVTGVMEDLPAQFHLAFDFIVSQATRRAKFGNETLDDIESNWRAGTPVYVRLGKDADPEEVSRRLDAFVESRVQDPELVFDFGLQSVTDIHLHSMQFADRSMDENPGNPLQLVLLGTIAGFILVLAGVNFINLTTARAGTRIREIGVRKASGAQRGQLIVQFLGESWLVCLLAMLGAFGLAELGLPVFRAMMEVQMTSRFLHSPSTVGGLVGIFMVTGALAGLYPALMLSAHQPARALRGSFSPGGSHPRKFLVTFQMVVSIVLVVGTMLVRRQLEYVSSKNLGFDTERVVLIRNRYTSDRSSRFDSFKSDLLAHPGVAGVAGSTSFGAFGVLDAFGTEPDDEQLDFAWIGVGYDFVETAGLHLLAGRDFDLNRPDEARSSFVINRKAARELGLTPKAAIGREITYNRRHARVIGVVEDFHHASLHEEVQPLVMQMMSPSAFAFIAVRIAAEADLRRTLDEMADTWRAHAPELPFETIFLDNKIAEAYASDRRFERIFGYSALIAIALACLGLFGLATFSARRRTKEIGIRKALGASALQVFTLLSKEFIFLTGVAFVIAVPLAWMGLQRWLDTFVYRSTIGMGLFVGAGVLALGFALLSVSIQTLRAAVADPVDSLRIE